MKSFIKTKIPRWAPLLMVLNLCIGSLYAQEISGYVVDKNYNKPLNEVEIWGNGKLMSKSDIKGKFNIPPLIDKITLRKVGFFDETFEIKKDNNIFPLQETVLNTELQHEVIFGKPQRKITSLHAFTQISNNQLIPSNSRSTAGLVTAQVPGLITSQNSAMPTSDAVALSLRGTNPMVILDGTPQAFAAINPEQIESITFLKDAISTAMLGMRSADGIMIVKTKTGYGKTKQEISVRMQTGINKALDHIQPLNAFDYATLYNEARNNDDLPSIYSDEVLSKFSDKEDELLYPDVNWYNQVMNEKSRFQRYDVSLTGGGKLAHYFVNLNYFDQEGLIKRNPDTKYNTSLGLKRYSFRSNTNINLTENIIAGLNVAGQFQNTNQPGATASSVLSNMMNTPSLSYPIFNANKSLGGNSNYVNNVFGQNFLTGYRVGQQLEYKVDLNLQSNFSYITKGLYAKAFLSYYNFMLENVARVKTFEVFQMNINQLGDTTYNRRGNVQTPMTNSGSVASRNSTLYADFTLGYNRKFGDHELRMVANANIDNSKDNSLLAENYKGLAFQTAYNFNERYLIELAVGYNGIERFAVDRRYGVFPALALGWNIMEEDFMKNNLIWIDHIKLRGSYGLTGAVTAGRYSYLGFYEKSGSYSFGTTAGAPITGITDVSYNSDVSWEKSKKLNIGIDYSIFKNLLTGSVDVYDNKFYDVLQIPNTISAIYGDNFPLMNIGKIQRKGFETQLNYQQTINKFKIFAQLNYGQIKSINTYFDEPVREYSWQVRTGKTLSGIYGYIAEGLFQNQQEIDNSPTMNGYIAKPGDIKYRDLNKDGIIDSEDQTTIGSQKPIKSIGFLIGFSFKNFDMISVIQGMLDREILWTGTSVFEFNNNGLGNAFTHHLNRWTPSTASSAEYPRLTVGNNLNNHVTSTYWIKSGNFFRLKSVELGYTLPSYVTQKISVPTIRLFFNGSNLFTWSKARVVDPESYASPYPMTSIFSGGINFKF